MGLSSTRILHTCNQQSTCTVLNRFQSACYFHLTTRKARIALVSETTLLFCGPEQFSWRMQANAFTLNKSGQKLQTFMVARARVCVCVCVRVHRCTNLTESIFLAIIGYKTFVPADCTMNVTYVLLHVSTSTRSSSGKYYTKAYKYSKFCQRCLYVEMNYSTVN
jgi:hypothetical protein